MRKSDVLGHRNNQKLSIMGNTHKPFQKVTVDYCDTYRGTKDLFVRNRDRSIKFPKDLDAESWRKWCAILQYGKVVLLRVNKKGRIVMIDGCSVYTPDSYIEGRRSFS